jgi:hypothetical protein
MVGWTHHPANRVEYKFTHSDGRHKKQLPEGGEMAKPAGLIAIANAIPDMGAMTRLDARENDIDDEGKRALQQAAESRCRT